MSPDKRNADRRKPATTPSAARTPAARTSAARTPAPRTSTATTDGGITGPPSADLCAEPLPDDAAIEQRVRTLLADADIPRRSALWLILIGPDDRQLPVLVPVDDAPARPRPELVDGIARLLSDLTNDAGGVAPGGSVVFALERPGSSQVGPDDVEWFTALHASARAFEIRVRGVYLLAGSQVRPVTLDDAA